MDTSAAPEVPDLATQLGRRALAARKGKRLSLRAAAEMIQCSPRFLHELERGKATSRMDKVQQALTGLGLRLAVRESSSEAPRPLAAQAEARAMQTLREEKLARAHDRIAALLALGKIPVADVGRALNQVRKWADQQICSQWYVDRWSAILAGSRREIAARIIALEKEEARALFQNTPFGFLVRDFLRA